jgi:hypothetical protein
LAHIHAAFVILSRQCPLHAHVEGCIDCDCKAVHTLLLGQLEPVRSLFAIEVAPVNHHRLPEP